MKTQKQFIAKFEKRNGFSFKSIGASSLKEAQKVAFIVMDNHNDTYDSPMFIIKVTLSDRLINKVDYLASDYTEWSNTDYRS